MISTLHPCLLFCDSDEWSNEEYKDSFIYNLIDHIEFINRSSMKIAWSDDFFSLFWQNSPWIGDSFYEPKISQYIYPKMENLWEYFDQYLECGCETDTKIKGNHTYSVERSWLILVHHILHRKERAFVVINCDTEADINRIIFFCNCAPLGYSEEFIVINKPLEWFLKVNYMDICPTELSRWDHYFKLALDICSQQDLYSKCFKICLENVSFSEEFKKDFLSLQKKGEKKRIIRKIAKLLTLNHKEAALDGGLQEEFINGKYRIRISEGSRVQYLEKEGRRIFTEYIPASKHDSVL